MGPVCHNPRLSGVVAHNPRTPAPLAWGLCATSPVYRGLCATSPRWCHLHRLSTHFVVAQNGRTPANAFRRRCQPAATGGAFGGRNCVNPGKLPGAPVCPGAAPKLMPAIRGVYAKITAAQIGLLPRAFRARCKVVIVALSGGQGPVSTSICVATAKPEGRPGPVRLCGIRLHGTGKRTSLSISRKEARYARHYCLA